MPEFSVYMVGTLFLLVALVAAVGWNLTCRISDRRLAAQVARTFEMPTNAPTVNELGAEEAAPWQLTTAA